MKKKAQMNMEDAPVIVLLVGLVFLVMATFAFIGEKYGDALVEPSSTSVANETGWINSTGYTLEGASAFRAGSFTITQALNETDNSTIGAGNYTVSSAGVVTNATSTEFSNVLLSYTYSFTERTSSFNVTGDLQTEIDNNTSIAGIVLTISLVGIVLTILIGVFMGISRRTRI